MLPKKKNFHRHHIIPKHMGGNDSDENLVYLTPQEHAAAHLELFELHGKYEDAQAFNSLSSQWCNGRTISGYKQSPSHIAKRIGSIDYDEVSKKLKGRVSPTKGMKFGPMTVERRKKISDANRGRVCSAETKSKISATLKGNIPHNKMEYYCILCRRRVSNVTLKYYHGIGKKNCIQKETK